MMNAMPNIESVKGAVSLINLRPHYAYAREQELLRTFELITGAFVNAKKVLELVDKELEPGGRRVHLFIRASSPPN